MKILLIGPPASGKGTVGPDLGKKLNLPYITLGQIFRQMSEADPDYQTVHAYMDRGELVPVQITARLIKERVAEEDCKRGYILDGWCRRMLDLQTYDPGFDRVVFLDISHDTVLKRITGRRICDANGEIYNIYTLPKEELDTCPGPLRQRKDDTEEVVTRRWEIHVNETMPVIEAFRERGILCEVNAEDSPEDVLARTLNCFDNNL